MGFALTPVSYTHLDVYKRQLINIALHIISEIGKSYYAQKGATFSRVRDSYKYMRDRFWRNNNLIANIKAGEYYVAIRKFKK